MYQVIFLLLSISVSLLLAFELFVCNLHVAVVAAAAAEICVVDYYDGHTKYFDDIF